jgi:hypothetical protein
MHNIKFVRSVQATDNLKLIPKFGTIILLQMPYNTSVLCNKDFSCINYIDKAHRQTSLHWLTYQKEKYMNFMHNKISDCGEINIVQCKYSDILYPCQDLRCTVNLNNRH